MISELGERVIVVKGKYAGNQAVISHIYTYKIKVDESMTSYENRRITRSMKKRTTN